LLFCKAHIESKQHKATILNEKWDKQPDL
jgi:hypothetical protein